jgi:serine/threonine protein kinase
VEVTRTGVVLGTPYYLAPEQARGERNLDARVDLYACGVLLYEALTGRRPFRAANYNALLIAILTASPRPVRELCPDLPAGFSRVLGKAMERAPADRFQTALEFQAALEPYSQSPLARRSIAPSRPPPRPSSGFPPAPPAMVPSRPPRAPSVPGAQEHATSAEDLAAFLESVSSDALPVAPAPSVASKPVPRASSLLTREPPRVAPRPTSAAPPPLPSSPPPAPQPRASVPAASPSAASAAKPHRRFSTNFDDQATEVDAVPRQFTDTQRGRSSRTKSPAAAAPGPKASAADAFTPRRSAPVLGPPLRPQDNASFADESATEIMSAAVRSKLPDPSKKA